MFPKLLSDLFNWEKNPKNNQPNKKPLGRQITGIESRALTFYQLHPPCSFNYFKILHAILDKFFLLLSFIVYRRTHYFYV